MFGEYPSDRRSQQRPGMIAREGWPRSDETPPGSIRDGSEFGRGRRGRQLLDGEHVVWGPARVPAPDHRVRRVDADAWLAQADRVAEVGPDDHEQYGSQVLLGLTDVLADPLGEVDPAEDALRSAAITRAAMVAGPQRPENIAFPGA